MLGINIIRHVIVADVGVFYVNMPFGAFWCQVSPMYVHLHSNLS